MYEMDDELMVNFVKEYPFLYDKRLKEYQNTEKKEVTWSNIALSLGYNVEDVKYRWKCLRCRFVRESKLIKNLPRGTPISRSRFPHFFMMTFLKNTITHRKRDTYRKLDKIITEELGGNEQSLDFSHLSHKILSSSMTIGAPMKPFLAADETSDELVSKRMRTVKRDLNFIYSNSDTEDTNNKFSMSDDEHFLLSLKNSMSEITDERRKNSLKIDILNLINNYLE